MNKKVKIIILSIILIGFSGSLFILKEMKNNNKILPNIEDTNEKETNTTFSTTTLTPSSSTISVSTQTTTSDSGNGKQNDIQQKAEETPQQKTVNKKENTKTANTKVANTTPAVSYVGKIDTEGNVDDKFKALLNEKMKLIPSNLLNSFYSKGYRIVLSSSHSVGNHCMPPMSGSVAGVYNSNDKALYISARESAINSATIHEFGHFIDINLLGYVSSSDEFKQIYNEEKDKFQVESFDGWYKTSSTEYFAEVFSESILNPTRCKNSAPKSYAFVQNKINSIG